LHFYFAQKYKKVSLHQIGRKDKNQKKENMKKTIS
jgi:hypothetical protein